MPTSSAYCSFSPPSLVSFLIFFLPCFVSLVPFYISCFSSLSSFTLLSIWFCSFVFVRLRMCCCSSFLARIRSDLSRFDLMGFFLFRCTLFCLNCCSFDSFFVCGRTGVDCNSCKNSTFSCTRRTMFFSHEVHLAVSVFCST